MRPVKNGGMVEVGTVQSGWSEKVMASMTHFGSLEPSHT